MATKNDITGDAISSKVFSEQGRKNYDEIFRKNTYRDSPKLVSASWCGPCLALKTRIAKEGLSVEIIDLDDNPTFAKDYDVKSVPCLVLSTSDGYELVYGVEKIIKELLELLSMKI
jgi:thiol-disulfide isomerase/thioredoxin